MLGKDLLAELDVGEVAFVDEYEVCRIDDANAYFRQPFRAEQSWRGLLPMVM